MNKYIYIFIAAASVFLGAACSSDNDLPVYAAGLKVVKAETDFGVLGETHEVVMSKEPARAYALDAWLTVTKTAEKLSLTAQPNTSAQSRNTLLVVKNEQGDSITLNIQQEGVTFGLPTGEDIYAGDEAVERSLIATSNVPVEYSGTADWIKVGNTNGKINVKVEANTTGRPRVGWVTAKAIGLVDSLKVVQASLNDVVGDYVQTAKMRLPSRDLAEKTSSVRIEAAGTNKANFIVDNQYKWEISFTPGKGFEMMNGKIVGKKEVVPGVYEYLISVIVADDFSKEHETAINGTKESILLTFDNDGNLVFREAQKLASAQTFSSYGWNRFTDTKPVMGAFRGIGEVYVNPKLTRR